MDCRRRDDLLMAYYHAQEIQAKAATTLMNEEAPAKHRVALLKSANARVDVQVRKAELEAHCIEHGCQLHKI